MAETDRPAAERPEGLDVIPSASIEDIFGGPDVTHVFVHDLAALEEDAEYRKTHPEACSKDERAVLIAGRDDVVCVSSPVDPDFLEFLGKVGIGPETGRVLLVPAAAGDPPLPLSLRVTRNPACLERLGDLLEGKDRVILSPYAATGVDVALAGKLAGLLGRPVAVQGGDCRVAEQANDKWLTYLMAIRLGVPVVAAELVALQQGVEGDLPDVAPLRKAAGRFSGRTGRAFIRGVRGTSGTTNLVADPASPRLESGLRRLAGNELTRNYLVQALFDILVSPNLQLYINPRDGKISAVASTDQLLDESLAHEGNAYPSLAREIPGMLRSAFRMAEALRSQGYAGFLGFDFVEYWDEGEGKRSHFLAEVNARVNGATYPSLLMERLGAVQRRRGYPVPAAFRSEMIRTNARSFREVADRYMEHLFDAPRGSGLFPFHIGALPYGLFGAVFFGESRQEVEALRRAVDLDGPGGAAGA